MASHLISIHAPTRGATGLHCEPDTVKDISIHAPTRGATLTIDGCCSNLRFQSTLPREERHLLLLQLSASSYFNPRSHERSDYPHGLQSLLFHNFNPRSHERSDLLFCFQCLELVYFNPRSHERSDSNIAQKICLFLYNTDNKYIIR